jgi:hypothetical protein
MKKMMACLLLLIAYHMQAQRRYDVVINEIMTDPSPAVALPASEWIELKNTSGVPVQLQGWRLGDASGESGAFPFFILMPDSFVIISGNTGATSLGSFGAVIGISSFPSLDNNGEILFLRAADGRFIHAVDYRIDWYRNDLKKEGGWSLEMIDAKSACAGAGNWKASVSESGGSPGKRNSVERVYKQEEAISASNAFVPDRSQIHLVFQTPLDSSIAVDLSHYEIDHGFSIARVELLPPLFNEVRLTTNTQLIDNEVYTLRAKGVRDCMGNPFPETAIKTGIPSTAMKGDIVINEILFNPRTNGEDYIELLNRSDKIMDAATLSICNRNNTGALNSISSLSGQPGYILPGSYVVLTTNAANLAVNYLVKDERVVLSMPSLPSFPDDGGEVILLNQQGEIIDEVNYSENWHFKLIENAEGISLERIDANRPSGEAANWHSASSTAGYGTPGYQNSQYLARQTSTEMISISTRLFSPDNDGVDDFLLVRYHLGEPGYVANITVFDLSGRPVRNLVRNQLLGISGSWNWDGLDEAGSRLRIGTYIILTELFNLQGQKRQYRNAVVLARPFGH